MCMGCNDNLSLQRRRRHTHRGGLGVGHSLCGLGVSHSLSIRMQSRDTCLASLTSLSLALLADLGRSNVTGVSSGFFLQDNFGCVIAQAFLSHGASAISLKSRVCSAEFKVI